MTDYVLGFLFNKQKTQVVLINKLKPEWQNGFLNGLGGKIESDEINRSSKFAMMREFREETGVQTQLDKWQEFAVMDCGEHDKSGLGSTKVFCLRYNSESEDLNEMNIKQIENEKPEVVDVCDVMNNNKKVIPNLKWLISLAIDDEPIYSIIKYR